MRAARRGRAREILRPRFRAAATPSSCRRLRCRGRALDFPCAEYDETSRTLKPAVNQSVPLWLRVSAWFSVIAWAVSITVLSSMSPRQLAQIAPFDLWDKAAHFLAFAA